MPSIGHIAVGMAAGQRETPTRHARARWMLWYVALSCAADLDFGLVILGVPKDSLWGHRGVSHSLLLAAVAGLVAAWVARRWGQSMRRGAVVGFLVYTSHIVFDCLNVGALGVPWFWPFTSEYFPLPWHPIPAVRTAADFLTVGALPVLAAEIVLFSPFWLYALLKPIRAAPRPPGEMPPRDEKRTRRRRPSRRRVGVAD